VVADPDVTGTFRGELKQVTLRQALDMVLQPRGFDYSVQGNLIRVFKRRLDTRIFDLNSVLTRRTVASDQRGIPSGVSLTDVASPEAGDVITDLTAGVQTLLSADGRFNMDRKAALMQVTDYADRLDRIGLYLDTLQSRAARQVSIQARVIEVELNDEFSSGIDWTLLLRRAGGSVSLAQEVRPSGGSRPFTAVLNIKDFPGLLTALGAQGRANVMATPHVNALNNEPAIMRVGTQDVFFRTTSQVDAAGRTLHTVEPLAVVEGVLLGVTPQISGDGMITLSITPSLTERTGQAVSRFGDAVPILRIREADTLVRVRENETVVIAGLMGTRAKRKTDLVILLTSTIVTPARAPLASARAGASLSE